MKPLWNVINMYMCTYTFTHVHLQLHLHRHIHMYMYMLIFMYRYMCMCVCVCVRVFFSLLLRAVAVVSLRVAETEQLYQAQRMFGGIGNVLLSTYSQTEKCDPRVSLVDIWGQVMTLRGQNLVSRTNDDPLHLRVYVQIALRV